MEKALAFAQQNNIRRIADRRAKTSSKASLLTLGTIETKLHVSLPPSLSLSLFQEVVSVSIGINLPQTFSVSVTR